MEKILRVNAKNYKEILEERGKAKGMPILDHKVEIYVPGTIDVSTQIDTSEYVDRTIDEMSESFGGATAINAIGAWVSKEGIVKEYNNIVFSNCNESSLNTHILDVIKICSKLKADLNQECVAYTVDGTMYQE